MLLGTAVAAVGLATAASSHLLLGRPHQATTNGQGVSERVIIVSALLFALIRGLPQLLDLVDHVQADRDEPLTTMVHVVRLVTTAGLAAGLLIVARARPHR